MKECVVYNESFKNGVTNLIKTYNYGMFSNQEILQEKIKKRVIDSLKNDTNGNFCVVDNSQYLGFGRVKILEWDTDFFGFPCASIPFVYSIENDRVNSYKALFEKIIYWLNHKSIHLTTIKGDSRDTALISILPDFGFKYIETTINLQHTLEEIPESETLTDIQLRFASNDDLKRLQDIAITSRWDRFHVDCNFSKDDVDKFRRKWINNLYRNLAGEVLVIEEKLHVTGFITCELHENNRYGLIKLIAVDPQQRRKGFGNLLVNCALNWFKKKTCVVYVSTQASNYESINMYLKSGFRLASSGVTMHRWS